MLLFIFYIGTGFYFLIMTAILVPKNFWKKMYPNTRSYVRIALSLFGMGLIISASYQAYVYYIIKPKIDAYHNQKEK